MAITQETLASAIDRAQARMVGLTDELNAADAKLGDGDTGTMLARLIGTFAGVDIRGAPDLGAAFMALAKAGAASTGSSLGTLVITAMMTAGKASTGKPTIEWSALSGLLLAIRDAAMGRGKAELGAKTIIDGLDFLARGIADKSDAEGMARAADQAMRSALDVFRPLPCTMGRARMFAEKSVGMDDPGMLALAELVWAVSGNQDIHDETPVLA